jgi:hypothetical protein
MMILMVIGSLNVWELELINTEYHIRYHQQLINMDLTTEH